MPPIEKVNLAASFARFHEHWSPKIAGEVNDFHVKLAKLAGEFVWHHHAHEDELFLVVKGRLTMRLPDQELVLEPGEFVIVPHGVELCPRGGGGVLGAAARAEVDAQHGQRRQRTHGARARTRMNQARRGWVLMGIGAGILAGSQWMLAESQFDAMGYADDGERFGGTPLAWRFGPWIDRLYPYHGLSLFTFGLMVASVGLGHLVKARRTQGR
jgi:mannose-6-phosphate isomerase-like protein (cupin superfamily)